MKENISKVFILVFAVLALLLVGCTNTPSANNNINTVPLADNNTNNNGNNTVSTETASTVQTISNVITTGYNGKILAGNKSSYIEFNTQDYEKATADGKVILLYFYSDVGPLSQAEEYKIFRAFDEMGSSQMIGFKVHFGDSETTDAEKQLASSLDVTQARTKVILKNGKVMQKSIDSWEIPTYAAQMSVFLS
jgi:hypothetical protein